MSMKGRFQSAGWLGRIAIWLVIMLLLTTLMLLGWSQWGGLSTTSLKWLQLCQTFAVFILPALGAVWLWSPEPIRWLHLDRAVSWETVVYAIVIMIAAVPGINLLSEWNQQMVLPSFLEHLESLIKQQEEAAKQLTEQFLKADGIGSLLLNIGLMALLPAIGEELTFRGVIQGLFGEKHKTLAIWITAAIFSFIHFQFYGFVPRMLMGVLFGYMLVWTGSLWVPILMHFTNNALAVILYYIGDRYGIEDEMLENFGAGELWWLGAASILAVCVLSIFFSRQERRG